MIRYYLFFLLFLLLATLPSGRLEAQKFNPDVASYIEKTNDPYAYLSQVEKLGIREAGTTALVNAFKWLKGTVTDMGYQAEVQSFVYNKDTLRNIVFTLKGRSDSSIIVCAHYDSWIGAGVNDNGTGMFALNQMAKWLKPLKTNYTVRFLYVSGEELGYLGSRHYLSVLNKDSIPIKYMVNFDQLGGTVGEDNSGVKCERDDISDRAVESSTLTLRLAANYSLYTKLIPQITYAYSSDYVPFRDSGYVITGVYQYAGYPYYHTESDLLKYVELNTLTATVRGALAFLIDISGAEVPSSAMQKIIETREISVYTTANRLAVINADGGFVRLWDLQGHLLIQSPLCSDMEEINLHDVPSGILVVEIRKGNSILRRKIMVSGH